MRLRNLRSQNSFFPSEFLLIFCGSGVPQSQIIATQELPFLFYIFSFGKILFPPLILLFFSQKISKNSEGKKRKKIPASEVSDLLSVFFYF
jgi:hypothetical protein